MSRRQINTNQTAIVFPTKMYRPDHKCLPLFTGQLCNDETLRSKDHVAPFRQGDNYVLIVRGGMKVKKYATTGIKPTAPTSPGVQQTRWHTAISLQLNTFLRVGGENRSALLGQSLLPVSTVLFPLP